MTHARQLQLGVADIRMPLKTHAPPADDTYLVQGGRIKLITSKSILCVEYRAAKKARRQDRDECDIVAHHFL